MSTPIIRFKRSSVPGKKPSVSQLPLGELALNTSDGQIFIAREVAGLGTDIVSVGSGVTFFRNNVEFAGISTFPSIFAGDINLTGVITATAFVGDGSQLTGLQPVGAAGTWRIGSVGIGTVKSVGIGTDDANASYKLYVVGDVGVTGIVSATSYEGSGSNLTGIVTSIIAGDNISVSGSTGQVTITGLANTANVVADSLQVTGITTLGVVSATSYEGDGSQLSGIVTSLVAGENINLSSSDGRVTITGLAKTDNIVADSLVVSGISTLGAIEATGLTVNGNVSIAGTLTYEDVKNVDSIGIITARSGAVIQTGAATTALVVEGDARVTGILTIGTSSLTLDGDNNTVQVGAGLTLGHTLGIQFGEQALHSSGFDAKQINTTGIITAQSYRGDIGATVGVTTGGRGALRNFNSLTDLETVIDALNELAENVINDFAVTNVDFTSSPTAGGSPLSVTLTITNSGNANRYDIYWGDGTSTLNTADSTPSHTYTQPSGGSFTIEVTAKNTGGVGAGSSDSKTRTAYIVVYTPDPAVAFVFYRDASGGSSLSGNDLYVVEGNSLYLDNNTTNTSGATVDYTVNWGDGSTNDDVANDTADGGADTSAGRLQHTWGAGTSSGTGRDTVTLTLNNHSTATPGRTPTSATLSLKVYDDAPSAPNGLSSKTISNVSSTGTSPRLAHGFTDNTGGTSLSAGNSVNRVTGGTATAGPITTFAYNADSGTLTANINGSADGSRALTSGNDSGTYTSLVIDSESDYQLLNASGSSTSFASSIYYPGLYKGFKARVAKSVASLSTGANSMQLLHSATGNTNTVEFVKDDLTASPTVNVGSATVTQNVAGTFRYISGIPYYNSGSPSLTLAGVTIDNLVGQCYTNQSNIVEVDDGTNQESTSPNAIANTDYTYANIDGATTMLSSGTPKANTGTSSAYAIGSLTVPITSSNVRTVSRLKVRARNVNGVSSYSSDIATNIQVHKSAQSGISEIAIAVADALGNGDYTDDGVRIFDLSSATTNTPSYTSSTNFYTNSVYGESSDPGVSGTKEATIRLGVLKYDVTDYSSGYLPAGPDRSGDTGTQYFTFAFRRKAVAGFNINITSSGIAGLWIAAPGTAIDNSSTLNGWLRSDQVYAGSGIPGGDTGNNGNGSDGCAANSGARIVASTALSGNYNMTLGTENMSNATGNVVLIRIALTSGQSVTSLSIN